MKTVLMMFLLVGTIQAKTVEVAISDHTTLTYIDSDDDGVFDSMLKVKENDTTLHLLRKVVRKPNKEVYQNSTLEIHLLNYNNTFNDAYFQIRVIKDGKVTGFYEHIMGRNELQYFEVE